MLENKENLCEEQIEKLYEIKEKLEEIKNSTEEKLKKIYDFEKQKSDLEYSKKFYLTCGIIFAISTYIFFKYMIGVFLPVCVVTFVLTSGCLDIIPREIKQLKQNQSLYLEIIKNTLKESNNFKYIKKLETVTNYKKINKETSEKTIEILNNRINESSEYINMVVKTINEIRFVLEETRNPQFTGFLKEFYQSIENKVLVDILLDKYLEEKSEYHSVKRYNELGEKNKIIEEYDVLPKIPEAYKYVELEDFLKEGPRYSSTQTYNELGEEIKYKERPKQFVKKL